MCMCNNFFFIVLYCFVLYCIVLYCIFYFCTDAEASRKVNTHLFRKLENITEDTYEAQSCKNSIKLNLPIQSSRLFVYQYAKLRMLQFYHNFDKYLDCADFQMCEMDMDSAYIAIAGDSVDSLVKPKLRGV